MDARPTQQRRAPEYVLRKLYHLYLSAAAPPIARSLHAAARTRRQRYAALAATLRVAAVRLAWPAAVSWRRRWSVSVAVAWRWSVGVAIARRRLAAPAPIASTAAPATSVRAPAARRRRRHVVATATPAPGRRRRRGVARAAIALALAAISLAVVLIHTPALARWPRTPAARRAVVPTKVRRRAGAPRR